jgi:hypothetical protein
MKYTCRKNLNLNFQSWTLKKWEIYKFTFVLRINFHTDPSPMKYTCMKNLNLYFQSWTLLFLKFRINFTQFNSDYEPDLDPELKGAESTSGSVWKPGSVSKSESEKKSFGSRTLPRSNSISVFYTYLDPAALKVPSYRFRTT